jgi:hypothetical protein
LEPANRRREIGQQEKKEKKIEKAELTQTIFVLSNKNMQQYLQAKRS